MNNTETALIVKERPSAMVTMASRMNVDPAKLFSCLKNTCFKNATDDEMLALVIVANEYLLNPLTKQIYAFPGKSGGIVPVVSIDGWCAMLNRQETLDGLEFEYADDSKGAPVSCTCVIYIKGRSKSVRVTEYYSECYRNTEPWKQMPRRMLRHKALIQAARVAFGFAGVYDEDEAEDIRRFNAAKVVKEIEKPKFGSGNEEDKKSEIAHETSKLVQESKEPAPEQNTKPDDSTGMSLTEKVKVLCDEHSVKSDGIVKALKTIGKLSARSNSIQSIDDLSDILLSWVEENFSEILKHLEAK